MFLRPFFHQRIGNAVRRLLFCLTVAAFVGKALIPAGYMPDASAGTGRFALTVCAANGDLVNFLMAAPGTEDSDSPTNGVDCPYGMSAVQDLFIPQVAAVLPIILHHREFLVPVFRPLPASPAQGPPLGSRAPPSYLV